MKKYLKISAVLGLLIGMPLASLALSVSWDRYQVGAERPLFPTDKILIGGSATTTQATLEVQGSFAVSTTTSGCGQFSSNGTLYSTGTACGSGSSSFGKTWEINANGLLAPTTTVSIAVSGTATSTFLGPVSIGGYTLATSTTICIYPQHCQYQVGPTSTSSDIQINAALLAVSNIGGGEVIQMPGNYIIHDTIFVQNNVHWHGILSTASTTIKADVGFNPPTPIFGSNGRRVMVFASSSVPTYNVEIDHLAFDGNVNAIPGLTSDASHKLMWFKNVNNLRIHDDFFTKGINWTIFVEASSNIWIHGNTVLGGFSTTYNQNDGIHVRNDNNYTITNNDVNTAFGGGTSGDDAIADLTDNNASADSVGGVISNNNLSSGSRGILLGTASSFNLKNIVVNGNTIASTTNEGILLQNFDNDSGQFQNISITGNSVYNYGLGNPVAAIGTSNNANPVNSNANTFNGLTISGNTISHNALSTDNAIGIFTKGNNLTITGNTLTDFTGQIAYKLGHASSPIKDITITGNTIDNSNAASGGIGMYLLGTERSTITGNTIKGNKTGTTYAIQLLASSTASTDSEVSAYNNVSNNTLYNTVNGIVETNATANPNNNQFAWNVFDGITTDYTVIGTNSTTIGQGATTLSLDPVTKFVGIGTSTPDTLLTLSGVENAKMLNITNGSTAFKVSQFDIRFDGSGNSILENTRGASNQIVLGVNGNVGISSTTPGSLFSIGGDAVGIGFTLATSTWSTTGGININSGCYAIGTTCLSLSTLSGVLPISKGGTNKTSYPNNSIITSDATGANLIATGSQLTIGNLLATTTANSGFGTSSPFGMLSVHAQPGEPSFLIGSSSATSLIVDLNGAVGIGTAYPNLVNASSRLTVTNTGAVDIISSTTDNTTLSTGILEAYAPGSRVFIGAHGTNQVTTQYGITVGGWAELGAINSSFGTSNGLLIGTRTTNTPIVFGTNSSERMRILGTGYIGIGTTTPFYELNISTTTAPQLVLSGSATDAPWAFRSIGGSLYLATTSATTFATSSRFALNIDSNGILNVNRLTLATTSAGCAAVTSGGEVVSTGTACGSGGGSGTVNSGLAGQLGFYNTSGTAISGTSTAPLYVGAIVATSSAINSSVAGSLGIGVTSPATKLEVNGNITLSASGGNTITTPGVGLILTETGDTFGTVNLVLENRSGTNGALLQNQGLDLIDLDFLTNSGAQNNLRMEHRASSILVPSNTRGEFEFFDPTLNGGGGTVILAVGASSTDLNIGNFGIATATPKWKLQVASTTQPQLALSGTINDNIYTMRSIGNSFYIATASPTTFATSSVSDLRIDANGAVYLPSAAVSSSNQTGYWCYDGNNQLIRDTIVCVAVSAKRFKEGIQSNVPGLNELLQLNPISYKLKPDYNTLFADNPNYNGVQYSLIADDVQKIDPKLVTVETSTTTFEGVTYPPGTVHGLSSYENWVALFVQSIKEQQKEIENLKIGVVKTTRSVEENWQWLAIGLLALGFIYQQIQIKKLKK